MFQKVFKRCLVGLLVFVTLFTSLPNMTVSAAEPITFNIDPNGGTIVGSSSFAMAVNETINVSSIASNVMAPDGKILDYIACDYYSDGRVPDGDPIKGNMQGNTYTLVFMWKDDPNYQPPAPPKPDPMKVTITIDNGVCNANQTNTITNTYEDPNGFSMTMDDVLRDWTITSGYEFAAIAVDSEYPSGSVSIPFEAGTTHDVRIITRMSPIMTVNVTIDNGYNTKTQSNAVTETIKDGETFNLNKNDSTFINDWKANDGYQIVGFRLDNETEVTDTVIIAYEIYATHNVTIVTEQQTNKKHTITVNVSGQGYSGDPQFIDEVAEGDTFTFDYSKLAIAKHYSVKKVKVDGVWQYSDLTKPFKLDGVNKDYTIDITVGPKDYILCLKKDAAHKDFIVSGTGYYERSVDDFEPLADLVYEKITFKDHYSLDVLTCDGEDITSLTISELIQNYEADSQDIITVYITTKEDPKKTITVDYNGGVNLQGETSSKYIEYVGDNFKKSLYDYSFVKYEGYNLIGFEVDGNILESLDFTVKEDTSVKLVWELITNKVLIDLPDHVTYNGKTEYYELVPYGESFTFDYSDLTIDPCYKLTQLNIMGSTVDLGDKIYIESVKEPIPIGLDAEPIEYTIEFVGVNEHCHGKDVNSFTATIDNDNGILNEDLISLYIDCDEHFFIDQRFVLWNGLNYSDESINVMLKEAYDKNITTLTLIVYTIEEDKCPVTIHSLDSNNQNKTYELYYNDKFTFPDKSDLGFSNPRELLYFEDGSGNQYKTGDTITVEGDLNFDCIWEPFEYSIEIDYNGGISQNDGKTSISFTYAEEEPVYIDKQDFADKIVDNVVKEGYHIIGFEKVNDDGTTSDRDEYISYSMGLTSNVKYIIVWQINKYDLNIHFEGATFDGSSDISKPNVEYGTTLMFPKSHIKGTEGKVLTGFEINGENVSTTTFDYDVDYLVFENITKDTYVSLKWEYFNYVVKFVPVENCKLIDSDDDFYYFTIEDIVIINNNNIEEYIESNDDDLYEFDHFEIDGQSYQAISWPNITSDITVKVFYTKKMATITYESDDATVTNPTNVLAWGSEYTIDVTDIEKHITTPDGSKLSYFEINGHKYGSNESMYYPCLEENLTVKAYYEKKDATITYTCSLPDSLTINDTAKYGSTYSIDSDKILKFYTLPKGFYIDYFEVDGVKYGADKVCTIDAISKDNYSVHVVVDTYKYTITYVPEDNCKLLDEAYNSQKWSYGVGIRIDENEIKYIVGPLNENCEYAYFTINDDPFPRSIYDTSGELEDVTVHVYYTRKQCEVSYTCTNGTVIDGGKVTIPMGDNYTVDANEIAKYTKANDGYKFDSFEVDGVTYKANESCEIKNIKEAKEVKVNFAPVFTIKFVAEDNCKLIDSTKDEIVVPRSEQFYVTKSVIDEYIVSNDDTYVLDYYTLNDGTSHYDANTSLGLIGYYAKDINTIHVYYKKLTYDVTFSNNGNATLKSGASDKVTYDIGSKVVINRNSIEEIFEPVEGCILDSFTVNGTKYEADETFTLDSIDSNVEVVVNYTKLTFTITIDLNGGVDPDNTVTLVNTVEYGDKFVTPNVTKVLKEHFEITDVIVTDSKGNVVTDQPAAFNAVKDNYNAKLIWTQNEFVVSIDPGDHGKVNSKATNNYYSSELLATVQSLTNDIDVEEGWYIDYFTLNDDPKQYDYYWRDITEDVVVHAHYAQIMVNITLKANNGIDTDKNFDVPYGDYTVPACDFKAPSGKEFDYWKVEINVRPVRLLGSGIKPTNDMKVKPGDVLFVKSAITLVAIYKDKPIDPKPNDPTPNGNTPNGNAPVNNGILPQTGGVNVSWYAVIIPAISLIAIGSALLIFLKKKSNKKQN